MSSPEREYTPYFKEEMQAKICIKLADKRLLDVTGLVRSIEGDQLTLELVGTEPVEEEPAEPGCDVFITFWTGWSLCRCSAELVKKISGRRVFLRLTGPVIEKQTREYFRLDVSIPLCYTIPGKQLLSVVREEWNEARRLLKESAAPLLVACPGGFKVVRWRGNGQDEIAPRPVNLSGGGLRFKTSEYVKPESLIAISLFLPLVPPRVIHTVAETIRCSEILLGREKGNNYITSARFHFIDDKDRETVIAFIFAEQRRLLNSSTDKRS
jgi:hypothetical protein